MICTRRSGERVALTTPFGNAGVAGLVRLKYRDQSLIFVWVVLGLDLQPFVLIIKASSDSRNEVHYKNIRSRSHSYTRVSLETSADIVRIIRDPSLWTQPEQMWKKHGVVVIGREEIEMDSVPTSETCEFLTLEVAFHWTNFGF